MAISINGTGSITGISAGGLPNNSITSPTVTDLDFDGRLTGKDGGTDKIQAEDGKVYVADRLNIGPNLNLSSDGGQLYSNSNSEYALYGESSNTSYCARIRHTGGHNNTVYALYSNVEQLSAQSSGAILGYSINLNTFGIVGYWDQTSYYSFYGNGAVAGSSFPSTSDERLKDLQGTPQNCLDKLLTLTGYYYTWKDNSQELRSNGPSVNLGLSAQEVQAVFPEAVTENLHKEITGKNPETLNEQLGSTLSIDYGSLVPALIESIKELKATIESLEAKVALLEGAA